MAASAPPGRCPRAGILRVVERMDSQVNPGSLRPLCGIWSGLASGPRKVSRRIRFHLAVPVAHTQAPPHRFLFARLCGLAERSGLRSTPGIFRPFQSPLAAVMLRQAPTDDVTSSQINLLVGALERVSSAFPRRLWGVSPAGVSSTFRCVPAGSFQSRDLSAPSVGHHDRIYVVVVPLRAKVSTLPLSPFGGLRAPWPPSLLRQAPTASSPVPSQFPHRSQASDAAKGSGQCRFPSDGLYLLAEAGARVSPSVDFKSEQTALPSAR